MKATILLGTLKKTQLSNTETLCEFLAEKDELLRKYEADYATTADKMIDQLLRFSHR
jgi:hypothetical protein